MVCKEANELTAAVLLDNPEATGQINKFSDNITTYQEAAKLADGRQKIFFRNRAYAEEAKLDAFAKARLVDSNPVYRASLLELYRADEDLSGAIRLIDMLDDLPVAL